MDLTVSYYHIFRRYFHKEKSFTYFSALKPLYRIPEPLNLLGRGKEPLVGGTFKPESHDYAPGLNPILQLGTAYDHSDYQEKIKGGACFYRVGYENYLMLQKAKAKATSSNPKDKIISVSLYNCGGFGGGGG